jgi:radical SAM superfamily enzyme YgiQ (UPF0313 family)
MKNILLVYPKIPLTYWGMNYSISFLGKRSSMPPLGLMTVAAMLPADCNLSLVDMNVTDLTEQAVAAADMVFISAMLIQRESFAKVVALCNRLGKPVVAGGPYPSQDHARIPGVAHFVLDEAEITLPPFLEDLANGRARAVYSDHARPDLSLTPPPRLDLVDIGQYANMALQYSRGCPFNCEFCDIVELFGRTPRTKTPERFIAELEHLRRTGWQGQLFIVDDNFIGNKKQVKELLPQIASWQEQHGHPFSLFTEATVSLADDNELLDMMVQAGFNMVFLGIETPVKESLVCAKKSHNAKSDLLASVRTIQQRGIEVAGGFIVGFDTDPDDIFERQIQFIDSAAIPTAMVGLLSAMPGTQLYRRMQAENRLAAETHGNNTHDFSLDFVPLMDKQKLLDGYKKIIAEIYDPRHYFERCLSLLRRLKIHKTSVRRVQLAEVRAFFHSLLVQTFSFYGRQYWKFILRATWARPKMFAETISLAVKGHHFFKMTRGILAVERFKAKLDTLLAAVADRAAAVSATDLATKVAELQLLRQKMLVDIRREYRRLHRDFRVYASEALTRFDAVVGEILASLDRQPVLVENS